MTRLHDLYAGQGQSPWLDDMHREWLTGGHLAELVDQGVRGVTSNPTIFAKAIQATQVYDAQFRSLLGAMDVGTAYWELVIQDITDALALLKAVYDESGGSDGFVSLEVAPSLARDTEGSVQAARRLHDRIATPNLLVKVPGTAEGVPAVQTLIGEGRSINVTLIFSIERYDTVMEAYLAGLEAYAASGASDLSRVHSVASFFVSRVDTEVDHRLEDLAGGTDGDADILGLRGKAAVAQAVVAYEHFRRTFSGPRWQALAEKAARVQRPLWASTSTKNPAYPDLLYVDSLIGPDTVNTMPEQTLDAFLDHGTPRRTVDADVDGAHRLLDRLAEVGVDMGDVGRVLEEQGVASFSKSFDELLQSLTDKANSFEQS